MLRLVIHGGTKFEPYRALFENEIGSPAVHFLETYPGVGRLHRHRRPAL